MKKYIINFLMLIMNAFVFASNNSMMDEQREHDAAILSHASHHTIIENDAVNLLTILPNEMWTHVVSFLDAKDFPPLSLVCKDFNNAVRVSIRGDINEKFAPMRKEFKKHTFGFKSLMFIDRFIPDPRTEADGECWNKKGPLKRLSIRFVDGDNENVRLEQMGRVHDISPLIGDLSFCNDQYKSPYVEEGLFQQYFPNLLSVKLQNVTAKNLKDLSENCPKTYHPTEYK